MTEIERLLARSHRDLDASRILFRERFFDQSASRSYYAAFNAAGATLVWLGITRSKHSGMIAAFGQSVIRDGGMDKAFGVILRSLFDTRNEADYGAGLTTEQDAQQAIEEAARFVEAVRAWLENRNRGT